MLKSVVRFLPPTRRSFVWRENRRFFKLECRENNARRFFLCFAIDAEGKKHRLFFPEGRGFLNGWVLLAGKIRGLSLKSSQEKKPMRNTIAEPMKQEGKEMKYLNKNKVFSRDVLELRKRIKEAAVWKMRFGWILVTLYVVRR